MERERNWNGKREKLEWKERETGMERVRNLNGKSEKLEWKE